MHHSETPYSRSPLAWTALLMVALAGLLLFRLSGFGIWDPWELEKAEIARRLAEGAVGAGADASSRVASLGFRWLGISEWAGRLPIVLCGIGTILVTLVMTTRLAGTRSGRYTAVVLATTPLFVLNARPMAGAAPAFLAQACVAWAGAEALLGRATASERWAWTGIALGAAWLSTLTSGVMTGPLPPLLGLTAVILVGKLGWKASHRGPAAMIVGATAGLAAATFVAIASDGGALALWTGGTPRAIAPPTYDGMLERTFHAAAPWSALVPLALGYFVGEQGKATSLDGGEAEHSRRGLGVLVVTWAACGYAAHTLYLARYGSAATYLPVVALAVLVGVWLDEVAADGAPRVAAAVLTVFLVGLLVRDFALFPASAIEGLAMERFELPKVFNPKAAWAVVLGLFGVVASISLAVGDRRPTFDPRSPYRLIASQWQLAGGARTWLILAGVVFLLLLVASALAWLAPVSLGLSVLGTKIVRRLGIVPIVLPLAVVALQAGLWCVGRAGRWRVASVLLAGSLVGAYTGHGFLPAVSGHLSPKEVYESFNRLAGPGEALAEYGVGGRAASYYAKGSVIELKKVSDVVSHLGAEGRRWAAFPAAELATVDRKFRKQTKRHLFVADAKNARVVLASNHPVDGIANHNRFAELVLSDAPVIEHPLRAMFDDRIELLGYQLELPHEGYVGAGETFTLTWYFRAVRRIGGDRKIFVHIDSSDQRIHGDHAPLEDRYPVRFWDPGDVLVDSHKVEVPTTQRPGTYTIFVGFFVGESRTPVTEGPRDTSNRVKAGVLHIR